MKKKLLVVFSILFAFIIFMTPAVYAEEKSYSVEFAKEVVDTPGADANKDDEDKDSKDAFILPDWDNPIGGDIGGDVTECKQLLTEDIIEILKLVFDWIKLGAAIGVIIFGMLDFAKVILHSDTQKEMEDSLTTYMSRVAIKHFVSRLVLAVLIFFTPMIIYYLVDLVLPNIGYCKI